MKLSARGGRLRGTGPSCPRPPQAAAYARFVSRRRPAGVMEERLHPELAEYQRQFRSNRREAAEVCSGLSSRQCNWRPVPTRWSIAESLVHLNVSADVYTRQIGIAIEQGRARGLTAP